MNQYGDHNRYGMGTRGKNATPATKQRTDGQPPKHTARYGGERSYREKAAVPHGRKYHRRNIVVVLVAFMAVATVALLLALPSDKVIESPPTLTTVPPEQKELEPSATWTVQSAADVASGMQVTFFDVGDADAAAICCEGHWMLIDGGTEKVGSRKLYAFLEQHDVTSVEVVMVSHPHSDHAGGLMGALAYEECTFGTLYAPVTASDNKSFMSLIEKAKQREMNIVVPDVGEQFHLGSATVTFLSPEVNKSYENVNNRSLVVRIDYGETSFLFTGDAMINAEDDLLRSGQNLQVDVLKVGHHGADTSTSERFLQAVSPEVAVISCGADNAKHPGQEVMTRLQQRCSLVLRTDQCGQIVVCSDGTQLSYMTEKPIKQVDE